MNIPRFALLVLFAMGAVLVAATPPAGSPEQSERLWQQATLYFEPLPASAPTRLKAEPAPIRNRPTDATNRLWLDANNSPPPTHTSAASAIRRRGPKRSSRTPTGICIPA